ncbi:MAG: lolA, partial [Gammaproteobacteria bacterium]|nr:lolA [Gammaproteobacteria bacterium]
FLLSDDNENILKKFAVTKLKTDGAEIKGFLLQPKQKDSLFTSLQLIFKQNVLQKIIMTDGLGQITTIQFTKVKANTELTAQLFSFNPPQGVEIIDNRF